MIPSFDLFTDEFALAVALDKETALTMRNRPRLMVPAALALGLAAAPALAAPAADPTPAAPAAPAAAAAQAPAPAHDHPIALRIDDAVPFVVNADGSRTAVLDDSFLSTSVARIDADGKVVIGCVHTREEYDAFFAAEALPDGAEVR